MRVAAAAADGTQVPTGPMNVAEQLPGDYPAKKVALDFRRVFQHANNAATTDAFSAYSFDGYLVLADAAARAMRSAEPGTPAFRLALLDTIVSTREVVGAHGGYNFKPGQLYGVDQRARVIVRLDKGQWELVP